MRLLSLLLLAVVPALAADYYPFAVDQDAVHGAADFSFLNHPLTAKDRVQAQDGRFVTESGARVRFFGVNLAFGANFPEPGDAVRIAKRLRRLGVNLVRLHHMDTQPDRDPNNAGSTLTTGPYPTLNPVSIARLRGFLDALKAEGVYANLNLKVGYVFRPDIDKVPAMEGGIPKQSKPLHMFWPRMVELQCEYTRKLIDALKLKNDPVLAMVEINNESSLLEAWQRGQMDKNVQGEYKVELERQRAGRPWPEFLAEKDAWYLGEMLKAVREKTDSKVPVTGTQMGYGGLLNLTSHKAMDYQDNHFYVDHYNFPNQQWDARDWRIRDTSVVKEGLKTYLNMASAREAGKPYTLSEYNQPWPNRHAAEIDPTMAAFAAFQDWDGLMHFAYSHNRNWDRKGPGGFDINGDWTKWPSFGQAAWLFRTGAIAPGKTMVEIPISRETQITAAEQKKNGNIAAFLNATAGYDPNVALVHRVGIREGKGKMPETRVTAPYKADTGQMTYDPETKIYTLHAPQAAGVFGAVRGKVTAGDIDVETTDEFSNLLITSLDEKPLRTSGRMLLTTPGYTFGEAKLKPYMAAKDWYTLDPGTSSKPSGNRDSGTGSVEMRRMESTVTLRSTLKNLTVFPLDGKGERLAAVPVKKVAGGFSFRLQADGQALAPWYEVVSVR